MHSEDPLVSVIIPTYNRGNVVSRAINSALNQSIENIEVIVVDDGSTDDTRQVINRIDDSRVIYLFQENKGANAARNTGLKQSQGEFITFLDSDDALRKEYLAKSINSIRNSSKECVGAATSYTMHTNDGKRKWVIPDRELGLDDFRHGNPVGSFSSVLFHKSVIEKVGFLDENLPSIQDYDYYIRIARNHTIIGLNNDLVDVYHDCGNRISDNLNKKITGQEMLTKKHRDVISDKRISRHHITRGKILVSEGKMWRARREFLTSIFISPISLAPYFYLFSCIWNRDFFYNIERYKNRIIDY